MGKNIIGEIQKLTITKEERKGSRLDTETPHEKEAAKVNAKATKSAKDSPSEQTGMPGEKTEVLELVKSMVDTAVSSLKGQQEEAVEKMRSQHQQEISELKESYVQQIQELSQEIKTSNDEKQKLEDLFKLTGNPNPAKKEINFNTTIAHDADKVTGILKEVDEIISNTSFQKTTPKGSIYSGYDTSLVDKLIASNRALYIEELEQQMKKSGLLKGNLMGVPGQTTKAATTISDIVGGFLPKLDPFMRETHRPGHIFWQFAETEINHQKGMGDTIQIPRASYQATSDDPADWELSGGGAFALIQDDYDPIQTGTVTSTLIEYGMGKASTNIKPVRLTDFVVQYSLINLINILNRNIAFNYCEFEDLKLRSLWSPTSRVVYNDGGTVTTTATDVDTGSNGTMIKNFLINLRAYMHSLQILPMMDNCYGLVLHPTALAQFQIDLDGQWEAPSHNALLELTNVLNPTVLPPGDTGKVSGYMGKYYGFHVFVQNAFAIGAAGTEGVQNVTLGPGLSSTLTRSSYAFGDKTIGRGTAEPMQLRQNEITNYGRKMDFIWRSVEGFTALDVDPTGYSDTSTVPQQLRVIEVRTLDNAA